MTFQAPDYNYWQVSTGSRTTEGDLKPQPNTNHALHPPGASPHLLPPSCGPSSISQPLPFLQDALQHLCSLWSHKPQINSIQRRRIHLLQAGPHPVSHSSIDLGWLIPRKVRISAPFRVNSTSVPPTQKGSVPSPRFQLTNSPTS